MPATKSTPRLGNGRVPALCSVVWLTHLDFNLQVANGVAAGGGTGNGGCACERCALLSLKGNYFIAQLILQFICAHYAEKPKAEEGERS